MKRSRDRRSSPGSSSFPLAGSAGAALVGRRRVVAWALFGVVVGGPVAAEPAAATAPVAPSVPSLESSAEATADDVEALPFEEYVQKELTRRCRGCHLFNEVELARQGRLARGKHERAVAKGKNCMECHEAGELCCHARQLIPPPPG